jgi:hypothetical protein
MSSKKCAIYAKKMHTVPQNPAPYAPTIHHKNSQYASTKNRPCQAKNMQATLRKICAISVAKNAVYVAKKKICRLCCKKNTSRIARMQAVLRVLQEILQAGQIRPTNQHNDPLFTTNNPPYHRYIKVPFTNTIAYPTCTPILSYHVSTITHQ